MEQIILRYDSNREIYLEKFAKVVSRYKVTKEENNQIILANFVKIPF